MTTSTLSTLSLRRLADAPHRLMFCIGAANLLLAMLWWTAWLASHRWGLWSMPRLPLHAGWLHAYVMQYQMLPSFVFGFLLTVFPRWMGLPEIDRWRYVPIGLGLFGGQLATLCGAVHTEAGLTIGWWMTAAAWIAGLATLGPLLRRERGVTWHARVCFAALVLGLAGVLAFGVTLAGGAPAWAYASIRVGTFGLLLPVYLAVAHRMFPFFAANAVAGYVAWRPLGLLAAWCALCAAHLALDLLQLQAWLWTADVPLCALTAYALWRWWPRGKSPGLLLVLFAGFAWLPATFALYALQSLVLLLGDQFVLGRAPAHALFVGFFGSVLVAMVTRVTQGHSGRPLAMPAAAWFAFGAIQLVAIARVAAEVVADPLAWHTIAGIGWIAALLPWVIRLGGIYLTPRADGRPG